jgi:hypothetical protein
MDEDPRLDPNEIDTNLERLRKPSRIPTGRELRLLLRIAALIGHISDVRHGLSVAKTAQQERATLEQLRVLEKELERLEEAARRK